GCTQLAICCVKDKHESVRTRNANSCKFAEINFQFVCLPYRLRSGRTLLPRNTAGRCPESKQPQTRACLLARVFKERFESGTASGAKLLHQPAANKRGVRAGCGSARAGRRAN